MQHIAEMRTQRSLAAILAADVLGYSRKMEQGETGTLALLKSRLRDVLEPIIAGHQGRVSQSHWQSPPSGRPGQIQLAYLDGAKT